MNGSSRPHTHTHHTHTHITHTSHITYTHHTHITRRTHTEAQTFMSTFFHQHRDTHTHSHKLHSSLQRERERARLIVSLVGEKRIRRKDKSIQMADNSTLLNHHEMESD